MLAAPALFCALALAYLTDLSLAYSPLPPHGKFKSGSFLDDTDYDIWDGFDSVVKKFKLNPPHHAGYLNYELLRCPMGFDDPYRVNVTVFDYQPFVNVNIKLRYLPKLNVKKGINYDPDEGPYYITVWRTAPFDGVMYGLVQIWCSNLGSLKSRSGFVVDDRIYDLVPLPAGQHQPHSSHHLIDPVLIYSEGF